MDLAVTPNLEITVTEVVDVSTSANITSLLRLFSSTFFASQTELRARDTNPNKKVVRPILLPFLLPSNPSSRQPAAGS